MSDDEMVIDMVPDDLSLARGQLASGLPGLAESVLRRRIARLETSSRGVGEELDAARSLLAEALWRQGRPIAAGGVISTLRATSIERERPIVWLIEAEAQAAAGQPDRAAQLAAQVVAAVGVDEAWRLRGGVASRIPWPLPPSFHPREIREADRLRRTVSPPQVSSEQTAAAHARIEAARRAYHIDTIVDGDRELGLALRLDPRLAAEGVAMIEPTLGGEPAADRLLLYGDLLRAAGRDDEASAAYERAAKR